MEDESIQQEFEKFISEFEKANPKKQTEIVIKNSKIIHYLTFFMKRLSKYITEKLKDKDYKFLEAIISLLANININYPELTIYFVVKKTAIDIPGLFRLLKIKEDLRDVLSKYQNYYSIIVNEIEFIRSLSKKEFLSQEEISRLIQSIVNLYDIESHNSIHDNRSLRVTSRLLSKRKKLPVAPDDTASKKLKKQARGKTQRRKRKKEPKEKKIKTNKQKLNFKKLKKQITQRLKPRFKTTSKPRKNKPKKINPKKN